MPSYVYVAAQDANQLTVLTIDSATGRLTPQAAVPMAGGPSLLAISPNRHCLYVGHRAVPEISSHRIGPETGGLTHIGKYHASRSRGLPGYRPQWPLPAGGVLSRWPSGGVSP
jgi:6-phosphogluconolactonase (cycloisomerase 2 family)